MSTRSLSFDDAFSKFPEERESLKRLESLLRTAKGEPEYTFEHLYHKLHFSSPDVLALVLAELAAMGLVRKLIRVESPIDKGGIADYSSVTEIPEEIHDWRTDQWLHPQPENLRVIYKLQAK